MNDTAPAAHPTGSELFDIPDAHLRARASLKWATVDSDVLPAWVAEMDVRLAPVISQTLQSALFRDDAGYPGSSDGVVSAFTGFASDRWHWDIEPEQISIHMIYSISLQTRAENFRNADTYLVQF